MLAGPLPAGAPRFDDAAISAGMFETAGPAPAELAEPTGCFPTRAEGIAARGRVCDELVAWTRATTADIRAHGLPQPVFGVFDGMQRVLFAAAHTDDHLPPVRALQAHPDLAPQGPAPREG